MMERLERNYLLVANVISVTLAFVYYLARYLNLVSLERYDILFQFHIVLITTILLMIVLMIVFHNSEVLAFYVPSVMLANLFIFMIMSGSSENFFIIMLTITIISGVYFSTRYFLQFIILANVLIFIALVLLRLPLEGIDVPFSSMYMRWFMVLISSLIVYRAVKHGVNRFSFATASMDSFMMMMATTPNLVAIVDR